MPACYTIMITMKKRAGFTLIELMVVLAVSGILLGFGVPQIMRMLQANRVVASVNSLSAHLTYARSEAVRRSTFVSVVALDASAPPLWELGWMVFVDPNNDAIFDPGEQQLRIVDALNVPNFTIRLQSAANFITFDSLGTSTQNTFDLVEADPVNPIARTVSISTTGHVSIP